jgi:coatomer protein complex subunit epsilon
VAATVYFHTGDTDSALRCLYQSPALECAALSTQIYISMDRLDLAKKEITRMQGVDEDATLTQLAMGWFNVAIGGDKCQDAFYIFQELAEKYSSTVSLLNAQASCYIRMAKYEEAESILQDALEKDSNNADTAINMAVLAQLMGKSAELSSRLVSQLKSSHQEHRWVVDYMAAEEKFNRCVAAFS